MKHIAIVDDEPGEWEILDREFGNQAIFFWLPTLAALRRFEDYKEFDLVLCDVNGVSFDLAKELHRIVSKPLWLVSTASSTPFPNGHKFITKYDLPDHMREFFK